MDAYKKLIKAIRNNNLQLDNNEFKAVLSAISRIEYGFTKPHAIKDASELFGVTQAKISDTLKFVKVRFVAQKNWRKSTPIIKEMIKLDNQFSSKLDEK